MIQALTTLEVIISILLVVVILVQNKNVSLNLSSMSSGMGEITKRGPEKVFQNVTIVLGSIFILNSIALFLLK